MAKFKQNKIRLSYKKIIYTKGKKTYLYKKDLKKENLYKINTRKENYYF